MEKAGRLIRILLLVQAYRSITALELSKKLDVSIRTIYRDIESLVLWGVPIDAESGPGGGYRLPEGYTIDPTLFTSTEVTILGEASMMIQSFTDFVEDSRQLESAKAKLLSVLSNEERLKVGRQIQYIYFDNSRWYRDYSYIDTLKILKDGVINNKKLSITFYERDDPQKSNPKTTIIDPYGLVYKSDTWYLVGHSYLEKRLRRWNTTRISNVEKKTTEFNRPLKFSLPDWWKEETEHFGKGSLRVLLQIDKTAWYRFRRFRWKKENRFFDKEKHIVVEMNVDRTEWIIDLVLVNRGAVEVIEPLDLRQKIMSVANTILNRHQSNDSSSSFAKNIVDFEVLSLLDDI